MNDRRAFMLPDVIVGIAIVAVLLVIMTVVLTRQQQATAALADHRRATRVAEGALVDLQMGHALEQGKGLSARDVAGAQAADGYRWIEVEAVNGKQRSTIVGLVPKDTVAPPAGGQP